MQARAASLAGEMQVDGPQLVAGSRLPHSHDGFPARFPRGVRGIDQSRIESQAKAVGCHGGRVFERAWVRAEEGELRGVVQIYGPDVSADLTAVEVPGGGINIEVFVRATTGRLDAVHKGLEGDVGGGDAIVRRTRVILNLLDKQEIGRAEESGDVTGDFWQVGGFGRHVFHVIIAKGEGAAFV